MPKIQDGGAVEHPSSDGCPILYPEATEGSQSCAWFEELDALLRAYHEELFCRINERLEASQAVILDRLDDQRRLRPGMPSVPPNPAALRTGGVVGTRGSIGEQVLVTGLPEARKTKSNDHPFDRTSSKIQQRPSHTNPFEPPKGGRQPTGQPCVKESLSTRPSSVSAMASEIFGGDDGLPPLQRLVTSSAFEAFFAMAIITNAGFIGIHTDHSAATLATRDNDLFFSVGVFYTLLFTCELILKLYVFRCKFFTSRAQWHWNYLDLFIVLISLTQLALDVVIRMNPEMARKAQGASQFRILRVLRVTRLITIIRATRIIRFIRALRTLVHQILSTLRSLVWALLLLLLIIFLFAILFTQAVTLYRLDERDRAATTEGPEKTMSHEAMDKFWSSLPRSMFTLFKAITNGISWDEVVQPLSDLNQLWIGMFVLYICFAQMAVLNVLTGVFCQNAIDSAQHDQDLVTQSILADKGRYVGQIQKIFAQIDSDNSGSISISEFREHLDDERMRAYFDALGLDTSDIWTLFKLMDSDNANTLDVEDFISGCMRLKGNAKGVDMAKLCYEHKWLSSRVNKFIARTDESLTRLTALQLTMAAAFEAQHCGMVCCEEDELCTGAGGGGGGDVRQLG